MTKPSQRRRWRQVSLRSMIILLAVAPLLLWMMRGYFVTDDIYEGVDYSKFVGVAAIDPKRAEHVMDLLDQKRIPNLVEGSVVYGVSVPPEHRQKAAEILAADARKNGYWISEN